MARKKKQLKQKFSANIYNLSSNYRKTQWTQNDWRKSSIVGILLFLLNFVLEEKTAKIILAVSGILIFLICMVRLIRLLIGTLIGVLSAIIILRSAFQVFHGTEYANLSSEENNFLLIFFFIFFMISLFWTVFCARRLYISYLRNIFQNKKQEKNTEKPAEIFKNSSVNWRSVNSSDLALNDWSPISSNPRFVLENQEMLVRSAKEALDSAKYHAERANHSIYIRDFLLHYSETIKILTDLAEKADLNQFWLCGHPKTDLERIHAKEQASYHDAIIRYYKWFKSEIESGKSLSVDLFDTEVSQLLPSLNEENKTLIEDCRDRIELAVKKSKDIAERRTHDAESSQHHFPIYEDELLPAAVEIVLETEQASVSLLQRRLKLGYSRAARLIDQMEELGFVGPFEGSHPRRILITGEVWEKERASLEFRLSKNNEQMTNLEGKITKLETDAIIRDEEIWRRKQSGLSAVEYELRKIDGMDGHAFEYWCADLLRKTGYQNVSVTRASGDQGVDVLAEREKIRYAVQCKCYASNLGNKPVQEVAAGKNLYHCQIGAVMTNRYFTDGAKELAEANGILLWDRDWISASLKIIENTDISINK